MYIYIYIYLCIYVYIYTHLYIYIYIGLTLVPDRFVFYFRRATDDSASKLRCTSFRRYRYKDIFISMGLTRFRIEKIT